MPQSVFVFKVALAEKKSIWRKIALRGDQTLDDLHEAIYDAFDRDDEHLYSFYFPLPGAKKSRRFSMHNGVEYASPFACEDHGPFSDPDVLNAAKTKIGSLKLRPKQAFNYLFDYGDEWWHEITVEEIDAPQEKGKYPRMLESHGESPPQYPDLDDEEYDEDDEGDDED
jgi:hypothetical protein